MTNKTKLGVCGGSLCVSKQTLNLSLNNQQSVMESCKMTEHLLLG